MSRAHFNADVIAELRGRVVAHNEALKARPGLAKAAPTKLGDLKKVYARNWRGRDPAARALGAVDRFLDAELAKAFDESKVERDDAGRFAPKGGMIGRALDSLSTRREHRDLMEDNAAYRAVQTDIIPETRYSLYGPPAALLAGGALGAAAAISPRAASAVGDIIGRRMIGEFVGQKVGGPVGAAAGAAAGASSNALRRLRGRAIDPNAGAVGAEAGAQMGRNVIRYGIGEAIAGANDLLLYPARRMKAAHDAQAAGQRGFARLKTRLSNAGKRAVIAGVPPGVAYAIAGEHIMTASGPYLDAAFPRRVEKLAKAELASLTSTMEEELAKASPLIAGGRALAGRALSNLRGVAGRMGTRAADTRPANVRSAIRALDRGKVPSGLASTIGADMPGRRIRGAGYGIAMAGGAALGGATIGAAGYGAARAYYRDKDGKFTSRDRAVMTGGAAAAGAVAGMLAGAAIVRGANRSFASAVATKLSGSIQAHADDAAKRAREAISGSAAKIRSTIEDDVSGKVATWKQKQLDRIKGFDDPMAWNERQINDALDDVASKQVGRAVLNDYRAGKPIDAAKANIIKTLEQKRDTALAEYRQRLQDVTERVRAVQRQKADAGKAFEAAKKTQQQAADLVTERSRVQTDIERGLKDGVEPREMASLYRRVKDIAPERLPDLPDPGSASGDDVKRALDALKAQLVEDRKAAKIATDAVASTQAAEASALDAVEAAKKLKGDLLTAKTPDAPRLRNPFTTAKGKSAYFPGKMTTDDIEVAATEMKERLTAQALVAKMPPMALQQRRLLADQAARMGDEIETLSASLKALRAKPATPLTPMQLAERRRQRIEVETRLVDLEIGEAEVRASLRTLDADPLGAWERLGGEEAANRARGFMAALVREYQGRTGQPMNAAMQRASSRISAALAPRWQAVKEDARSVQTAVGGLLQGGVADAFTRASKRVRGAYTQGMDTLMGPADSTGKRQGGLRSWYTDPQKRVKAARAISSTLGVLSVVGLADKAADGSLDLNFEPLRDKGLLGTLRGISGRVKPYHYAAFDLDPRNSVLVMGATFEQTGTNGKKELIFARGQISYGDDRKPVDIPNGTPVSDVLRQVEEQKNRNRRGGGEGRKNADTSGMNGADVRLVQDALKNIAGNIAVRLSLGSGDDSFDLKQDMNFEQAAAAKAVEQLRRRNADAGGRPNGNIAEPMQGGVFYKRLAEVVNSDWTPLLTPFQARDALLGHSGGGGVWGTRAQNALSEARNNPMRNKEEVLREIAAAAPPVENDDQARNLRRALLAMNASLKADDQLDEGGMQRVFNGIRSRNNPQGTAASGGAAPAPFPRAPEPEFEPLGADSRVKPGSAPDMLAQATEIATARLETIARSGTLSPQLRQNIPVMLSAVYDRMEAKGSAEERWDEAINEVANRALPKTLRRSAPVGDLAKAAREDGRSYFEPVRFGGTVGNALLSTAGFTLADQFMPAPLRAAGFARRMAWRFGVSGAGGVAGQVGGEALGRQAYGAGRAPQGWQPPNRELGEEGARLVGSTAGELFGAGIRGSVGRKILVGTAASLAGEEAAGASYRAAAPRVDRVIEERRRARAAAEQQPRQRPPRPPV